MRVCAALVVNGAFLPWSVDNAFGIRSRFWWWRALHGSPTTITGVEYGEGWVEVVFAGVAFGLTFLRHRLVELALFVLGTAMISLAGTTAIGVPGFRLALGFYLTTVAGVLTMCVTVPAVIERWPRKNRLWN